MTKPRAGLPASQRPPAPPAEPEPTQHPTCWACGWLLFADFAGDLWCPHPACPEYRVPVGAVVAAGDSPRSRDRLREAIDQARQEAQRDDGATPPATPPLPPGYRPKPYRQP